MQQIKREIELKEEDTLEVQGTAFLWATAVNVVFWI